MSSRPEILDAAPEALRGLERELIIKRQEVRQFIEREHTAEQNLEMTKKVRECEEEIAQIHIALLENREIAIEFIAQATELTDRCRKLNGFTRDMFSALARDLVERRRDEDKKKLDPISSASLIYAGTNLFMAGLNYGIGKDRVSFPEAAGAGLFVSSTIVFRKRIMRGLRRAGTEISKQRNSQKVMDYRIGIIMAIDDVKRNVRKLTVRSSKPEQ